MAGEATSPAEVFAGGGEGQYPIVIGAGVSEDLELVLPWLDAKQLLIVTSDNLLPLATPFIELLSNSGQFEQLHTVTVKDGDEHKSLASLDALWHQLIEKGFKRDCLLLAIGGGMIGDLTGFAAATYMRGVSWVNFPTTLLAQVDAAIGGKTAVNHPLAKNMVGAFHAPKAVFSDVQFLKSLPGPEYLSGLAEVLKYGIALDDVFLQWLESNIELILKKDPKVLSPMVEKCSSIKARIVTEDFKESGQRALLNFGHTLGHAIETALDYSMSHGFAVSIGMVAALQCSQSVGLEPAQLERAVTLLQRFGLPVRIPESLSAQSLMAVMRRDKKNVSDAALRMILVTSLGQAQVTSVEPKALMEIMLCLGANDK